MLDKMTYTNHLSESIAFGEGGIFANYSELRDYSWSYSSDGGKISDFKKEIKNKKLPVLIACKSDKEGIDAKNRIFEVFEKDVLSGQYGKLAIGDYYLNCYVTESKKSEYLLSKRMLRLELTVTSDQGFWIKENKVSFSPLSSSSETAKNLDHPFDYPYDYTSDVKSQKLGNLGIVDMPFKLIFYGPCINPAVYIADHLYQVNCTLESGEYLTVDSEDRTITLTTNEGLVINKFANRNRESYIFKRIPPGSNTVTWDGSFGFDVILYEERSEPKWT